MKQGQFTKKQIQTILKQNRKGISVTELAEQHGVSPSTLYRWKALYQKGLSSTEGSLAYVTGLPQVLVEVTRIFMEAELGQLDDHITKALQQLGEYCDVDRAYLFRFKNNLQLMDNTHEWCAPGITSEMDNLQDLPREAVPNVMRHMERHEIMSVPKVSELGAGWENDRAVFEEEDIQSLVVVPMVVDTRLLGFTGFDSVRRQRNWLEEELRLLGVSGDLIGAALERDVVEQELQASQSLLQRTEDLARVGSWEWRISDNRFYISDTFAKLQGCEDATLGRDELFERFVHPDDLPGVKKRSLEAMESGEPYRHTYRIIRGDSGEVRWVHAQGQYYYANGKPVRMQGFMQDITERKQADQALIDSEKRYRTLVENLQEIVFEVDTEGCWTFLNAAWEQVTGFSVAETLGTRSMDYIFPADKQLNRQEISSLLRGEQDFCRHEIRFVPRSSTPGWIELHARRMQDEQGRYVGISGTLRDITLQRQAEDELVRLAQYDSLTGLPNRWLVMDRLGQYLLAAQRREESVAILFIDIDHFKKVNDTLGHETGDLFLTAAAQRLTKIVRKQDTVARLGGDEFLIVLSGISDHTSVQPILHKLLDSFQEPFRIQGHSLVQTASVGVAIAPNDGDTPQELLRNADMAMYKSKATGRNTYHFFTESMSKEMAHRVTIEDALRQAMSNNELYPVFQPLVELTSGRIIGAEILLRWHSQSMGAIAPMEFIPVAEQTGLIEQIGQFVIEQAVCHAAAWRKTRGNDFYISVNVSPQQFRDPRMPEQLLAVCNQYDFPSECVVVEITEGVLLSNQQPVLEAMHTLRKYGVRMAMDDFGTGYASLSYLRQYPFDLLKIDRSFVRDCISDTKDAELVTASLRLAAGLGLQAIAEGVETEAQMAFLRDQGCPTGQGYLFSHPLRAEEMTKLVSKGLSSKLFVGVQENEQQAQ